ncbi:LysR family transcriptional regulator [Carnimonas bestiolae]|uniref:LysR family transcriptional regulator n=1 Tax=Carnimonas bestiolae TaxID=3402172 RepID=UPI003EDBD4D3
MDTQSLIAFVAVAELGSFSQAAHQLHLTQPAVSKRVAVLEGLLNQRLFDRLNRTIRLTDAGRRLLPRARQIIALTEEANREVAEVGSEPSGTLRLATSHHVGLHRLPLVLKEYASLYPKVRLELDFLDSEQAHQKVADGSVELAVVTLAPQPDSSVNSAPLWIDRLRYVCALDHPLTQNTAVTLAQLAEHEAVLPANRTFTRQLVADQFAQLDLSLQVAMSTNYLETLKMLATVGLGWGLLPERMVDANLHLLPVNVPVLERPLGYLHHQKRTLSRPARAMIALLDQHRDLRR